MHRRPCHRRCRNVDPRHIPPPPCRRHTRARSGCQRVPDRNRLGSQKSRRSNPWPPRNRCRSHRREKEIRPSRTAPGFYRLLKRRLLCLLLSTRETVDADRRKEPPPVGRREQPSCSVGGREWTPSFGGPGGTLCAFMALLSTREDVDAKSDDQRPSYKPWELLHCYESDRTVPKSHKASTRPSEHGHISEDPTGQEFYGLSNAGNVDPV